jgi:hypothetical protein
MPNLLLLDFDLTKTLKAENLQIPSSPVRVTLDVDKGLEKILQADPLIHQQLADAGIKVLQDNRARAQQEIKKLDRRPEDPRDLEAINKELKDFCASLAKESEKDARDAIEKQWKTIQGRQQALKTYKIKVGFKITLNVISVLTSVASAALSVGTLWMSMAGALKSTWDIVVQLAELMQSTEEAGKHVQAGMAELNKRYQDAITAWKETKESTREVWDTVSPLGKIIGTSLGTLEGRVKVYAAKLQGVEGKSSELVKKTLKVIEEVKKVQAKVKDDKKREPLVKKLADDSEKMLKKVHELQNGLKKDWAYCEEVKRTIALYKDKRNAVLRHTKFASELTALSIGLTFLVKGIVAVSKAA